MKNIILIPIFFLSILGNCLAQIPSCVPTNSLNISTGIDASGNNLPISPISGPGIVDPYWQLVNVPPPSINGTNATIPNAYTIPSNVFPGWCYIPGTVALSVVRTPNFNINNLYPTQFWTFIRKFNITTSGTITINGSVIGDDQALFSLCDQSGNVLYSANTLQLPFGPVYWNIRYPIQKTLSVDSGCYFVKVSLLNTDGVDMGFAVNANITSVSKNMNIANPGECCATSVISGQKIIDKNCNDLVDPTDVAGAGWTINLYGGTGLMQTTTTDANGEFYFYGVPNGSYTVQEVNQTGYTPEPPSTSTGSQIVTISQGGSVKVLQFLNCPVPPCSCGKWIAGPTLDGTAIAGMNNYPIQFVQGNVLGQVNATYQCTGNCGATYTWDIKNDLTSAIVSSGTILPVNLTLYNSSFQCGTYTLTIKAKCGNDSCDNQTTIPITIICEPPACCKAEIGIDLKNSSVTAVTNISNPNAYSTANLSYTLNYSLPMSEVRVSVEEFKLVANSPNCLNCNNRPVTWGNILSASLNGQPMTLSGMLGPPTGSLPADYREAVYDPASPLPPPSAALSIQLSLPAVTELSCCDVSAYVCLKFTFKDTQCRECTKMVCGNIKLVTTKLPNNGNNSNKMEIKKFDVVH